MKKILPFLFTIVAFAGSLNAQVTRLSNNTNLGVGFPISSGKAIFLQKNSDSLWVTDGTVGNTFKLNIPVTIDTAINGIGFLNNKLYFSGVNAANGSELWVTDGTVAGTSMVKDINPGIDSSSPRDMGVFNNELYFYAYTPAYGEELWKSDGTDAGTVLVRDINSGTAGSFSSDISYAIYNNALYFSAVLKNGLELWKTDGTTNGTVLIKDINPGPGSSQPEFLQVFNNALFFTANDGTTGRELWKTDGTEAGTTLVYDLAPGIDSSQIESVIQLGNKLLFNAEATANDKELYSYDPVTNGIALVKDIDPGAAGSDPDITGGIIFNNKIVFAAATTANGRELWVTDGTTNGTSLFKDIVAGPGGSSPDIWLDRNLYSAINNSTYNNNALLYNGKIFFFVSALVNNLPTYQLWITDGTPNNTVLVKDFGIGGLFSSYFYTQSGLYFAGKDPAAGLEVFKSQGTPQTTALYDDVNPGAAGSTPIFEFFILNGKVFFIADDGDSQTGDTDLFVLSGNESTLPLQILQFAAAAARDGVNLTWSTANERNTKDFEVQRSVDGLSFNAVTTLQAAGNSSNVKDYSWLDKDAYNQKSATLYYRLKQVDINGKYNYSKIAMIQIEAPAFSGLQVSPNPASGFIRLNYSSKTETTAQLRIMNNNGQLMKNISTKFVAGNNQQVINLDGVPPGIYHAELIIQGKAAENVKFVKE